jgi:hypothetical protein
MSWILRAARQCRLFCPRAVSPPCPQARSLTCSADMPASLRPYDSAGVARRTVMPSSSTVVRLVKVLMKLSTPAGGSSGAGAKQGGWRRRRRWEAKRRRRQAGQRDHQTQARCCMQLTGVDVGGAGGLQGGCDGQADQQACGHGGGAGHGCGGGVKLKEERSVSKESRQPAFMLSARPRARPPRLQKTGAHYVSSAR